MVRNIAKPLNELDAKRQQINLRTLEAIQASGKSVTVSYTKRDLSEGTSTGTVAFFNGTEGMDTASVSIADPVKGNRTINLHRIHTIE